MDVVGTEIGQKMRSAIKAKLTELGCYVDDELPDYVMVMVANKRTRVQMEEDLQLFLGDNTELFVNWLHQVLKKLQEVTVAPLKGETEKSKEKVKEKRPKEKKDKDKEKVKLKKIDTVKKAKKKDKEKEKLRKKEEKKLHKSKKKSKHHEMIRPNIPPLLMNIEKESEPSITDVFAGQILKNHGITLDLSKEDKVVDKKPVLQETKRPILPIIDPATISSQPEAEDIAIITEERPDVSLAAPRDEQIKEINEIEAKIQGLKQKLAEQLDSMSDDEDFLNIRTEAEELMNDFAEDVFQEISSQAPPVETLPPKKKTPPPPSPPKISFPKENSIELPKELPPQQKPPEELELPQIELNLPKRPIRERLGTREEAKKPEGSAKKLVEVTTAIKVPESSKEKENKRTESPERYTPDRDPFWGKLKSAKSRLGDAPDSTAKKRNKSDSDDSEKSDSGFKKSTSNVAGVSTRRGCVSVVSVRPRPRAAAAPSLLLRAVADAHKSLLNIPPKMDVDQHKIKRALVLPMRRCVDAQKIVIQVPRDRQTDSDLRLDLDGDDKLKMNLDKDEYIPTPITKKITNTDYVPSRRLERTTSRRDDTLIVETINIHNTTVDKDKTTQFIVTMDGFNPNAFLAKKLKTEGLLDEEIEEKPKESNALLKGASSTPNTQNVENVGNVKAVVKNIEKAIAEKIDASQVIVEKEPEIAKEIVIEKAKDVVKQKAKNAVKDIPKDNTEDVAKEDIVIEKEVVAEKVVPTEATSQKKRLSDTSDDSDTQVIIKPGADKLEKRKIEEVAHENQTVEETMPTKKRKASPIVFDVAKKDVEVKRERTESVGSDNHVTVTTTTNTHKYDSLPSLPSERKIVWCRSFPLCRWGSACAFSHPRCKFAAACTRRGCVYDHSKVAVALAPSASASAPTTTPTANVAPVVASHVVPAANYKTISSTLPSVCKYYPNCVNPACHFYHPKPCRYGKACANKLECNFYHADVPSKWRYTV